MNTSVEGVVRGFTLTILLASLGGCAWIGIGMGGAPLPRQAGLYAVENGRLQRLDGDQKWELKTWDKRSSLSPQVEFMIRHPQLEEAGVSPEAAIRLSRVAWIRSEISQDGEIGPVGAPPWAVTNIQEQQVSFGVRRHDSRKDVIRIIPEPPLQPGLYSLQFPATQTALTARLGVGWGGVDKRAYSAANCVDRYLGDKVQYRPCAEQEQAMAVKWLRIHLVDPEAREVDGQRKVIVRGVVVNSSQRSRKVPMLEAHLRGANDVVLKRWQFPLAAEELAPGASARFRSEVPNPPPGVRNIHVTFAARGMPTTGYATP